MIRVRRYTIIMGDKSYTDINSEILYNKFKSYVEEYTKLNII